VGEYVSNGDYDFVDDDGGFGWVVSIVDGFGVIYFFI